MKPGRPEQKDNLYIRDARVGLGPVTIPGLNVPIGLRRAVGPETSREAGSSSLGRGGLGNTHGDRPGLAQPPAVTGRSLHWWVIPIKRAGAPAAEHRPGVPSSQLHFLL